MANYRGHVAGGLIGGILYAAAVEVLSLSLDDAALVLQNWQLLGGIVSVAVLFGLFPDVDTNSKAQNLFIGLAFILDLLLIFSGLYQLAAYLGLVALTPIVGKHRGWTHHKLSMILIPLPIMLIPYLDVGFVSQTPLLLYGAAVTGYFTHLLFDGLIWRRFRIKN